MASEIRRQEVVKRPRLGETLGAAHGDRGLPPFRWVSHVRDGLYCSSCGRMTQERKVDDPGEWRRVKREARGRTKGETVLMGRQVRLLSVGSLVAIQLLLAIPFPCSLPPEFDSALLLN